VRGAWFSRLLRHPARKRSWSILSHRTHTGDHTLCVCVSYHVREMPVVLVFGIATTVDSVHRSLPHRITSLLSMEKFQAPSSSDYLSMVLQQVSISNPNCNCDCS